MKSEKTLDFMTLSCVKLFLFTILFIPYKSNANEIKSAIYVQYANEITADFAREIKKEYDLQCIGTGGSMPYDIREIDVKFYSSKPATIQEARELEVVITEKFLNAIHSHEKIRPYLSSYPLPINGARIAITFPASSKKTSDEKSVAYVFQLKNRIFYCSRNSTTGNLEDLYEESYEDALKIVIPKKESENINTD